MTLLLRGAEVVAPRLTRDKRHAQYRVRCAGNSCRAIHFNFDRLDELKAPGRHDVALTLTKDEYHGSVSAQVQVRSLHRLVEPEADLCVTACEPGCRERLTGSALWAALLGDPDARAEEGGAGAPAARPAACTPRRAAAASSTGAAARRSHIPQDGAGGRLGRACLVLVPTRAPSAAPHRDVLAPTWRHGRLRAGRLCAAARLPAAADVVMDPPADVPLADPALMRGRRARGPARPALHRGVHGRHVVAAAPEAHVHALWGAPEADVARRLRESRLDLDAVMRRTWRVLSAGSGRFDERLEQELLGEGAALPSLAALTAALSTLREAGLLVVGADGGYHLERPQNKVDVTRTDTHRRWHNRYQRPDFLPTCLTARL